MAVIWSNTFDGPDDDPITVANSASYGDALSAVAGVARYSTSWAAAGTASAYLGSDDQATDGVVSVATTAMSAWSVRLYFLIPTGAYSWATATAGDEQDLYLLDSDVASYTIGTHDVSAHAADLVGQPVRFEAAVSGSTITYRVWWTDPASTGTPDWEDTDDVSAWGDLTRVAVYGGAYSTPPSHLDELAVAEGEWIGPASVPVEGTVEGGLALSGTVTGHKLAYGTAEGHLAVSGALEGTITDAAQGRLVLSGTVSGGKHSAGAADGSLVLSGTVEGYKRAYGTVEGSLTLEGALVQLIVPVPALSASVTPIGRLAATAVRK